VSDIGCGIVFFSFVLMTFVESGHAEQRPRLPPPLMEPLHPDIDQEYRELYQQWRLGHSQGSRDEKANFYFGTFGARPGVYKHADCSAVGEAPAAASEAGPGARCRSDPGPLSGHGEEPAPPPRERPRLALKAAGVCLAVLCGVLTGTCAAPATLYNLKHPGRPTAAVFGMCLGVWVMSTVLYLLYAMFASLQRIPVRHSAIRPAFFSGALWSIGNACNLLGVTQISYTLCYSTGIIGCLILAGIYSLAIFREIEQPLQIGIFCAGLACQSVGVAMIAIGSGGGSG